MPIVSTHPRFWERGSVSLSCLRESECVYLVPVGVCFWVCGLCPVLETVGVSVYMHLCVGLGWES